MKKILMVVPYFIQWLFYFFLTMEERDRYLVGSTKGYHCNKSYDSSLFLYGSQTTYEFDRDKKPKREYLTWKEFWFTKGY